MDEICNVLDHLMTEKVEKPHLKDQTIFCRIIAASDCDTSTSYPNRELEISRKGKMLTGTIQYL